MPQFLPRRVQKAASDSAVQVGASLPEVRLRLSRRTSTLSKAVLTPNLTSLPEGGVQVSVHWVQPELLVQVLLP